MKQVFGLAFCLSALLATAEAQVRSRVSLAPPGGAAAASGAGPRVRMVDNTDGTCSDTNRAPYCSIAAAVADALPGDTIHVLAGVYAENVEITTAGIVLEAGEGSPEIHGGGALHAIRVSADDVTVRGFTLQSSSSDAVHAENVFGLTLADNLIRYNGGDGIELRLCEDFHVAGNDFVGNVGNGLQLQGCTGGIVSENLFFGNAGDGVGAFDFLFGIGCSDVVYDTNEFLENTGHGIISVGDRNTFFGNVSTRSGFQFGDRDFEGIHISGDFNQAFDNDSIEANGEGFHFHGSGNLYSGNRAIDSSRRGFFIDGDMNVLVDNLSERSGLTCTERCDWEGYYVLGHDNDLHDNVARASLTQGLVVAGDRNFLRGNVAEQNGSHGFEVEKPHEGESRDNTFLENAANDNAGFGYFDVTVGGTGPAGTENRYRGNVSVDDVAGPSSPDGLLD